MEDKNIFEAKLFSEYTIANWLIGFVPPQFLYHYTGDDGYNGIIKNNALTFRFTRSDCFDDNSEGVHILKYYRKACKLLLLNRTIRKEFYNLIKDLKPVNVLCFKNSNHHLTCCTYTSYICCFTEQENSLKMWKNYGKGKQKYKLVLSSSILSKYAYEGNAKNTDILAKTNYCKVIYKAHEKINILLKIITSAYELYKIGQNELAENLDEKICALLKFQLQILQYSFKKRKYAYEKEYRIIHILPNSEDDGCCHYITNSNKKQYVDLTVEADELYLYDVKTRPQINVYDNLRRKGFKIHHAPTTHNR